MALVGPSLDPFRPPFVFFVEDAEVVVLSVLRPASKSIHQGKKREIMH